MADAYSLSGISPFGYLGLGSTGRYGNYDQYMPSMMGMNMMGCGMNPMFGGLTGMGTNLGSTGTGVDGLTNTSSMMTGFDSASSMIGANGMGMMGSMGMMYNPLYYSNMMNQAQVNQLQYQGKYHDQMVQNEINALQATDSALIQKVLTNSDVQRGIQTLYTKVKEGDQDGICSEYDKLKNYIFNNYRDELNAKSGKINPSVSAGQIIDVIYGQMASNWEGGRTISLMEHIKENGDGSLENGFLRGLRPGMHKRYVDETLNHIYGMPIDDKKSKDRKQSVGEVAGRAVSVVEKGAYGAAAGAVAYTGGVGLSKLLCATIGSIPGLDGLKDLGSKIKLSWGGVGAALGIGILAGMALDAWWQISDSSTKQQA